MIYAHKKVKNDNIIGKRLYKLRIDSDTKVTTIAEYICNNYSKPRDLDGLRTEYYKWENGNLEPSLEMLTILCNFYDCEIDYLLGKIEEKKHLHADIKEETGLSANSIAQLKKYLKGFPKELYVINELLSSFPQLITAISDYFFLSDNIQTEFHIDTLNGQIAPKEKYIYPLSDTELTIKNSSHNLPINADLLRNALINSIQEKLILFKNNYIISIDKNNDITITTKAPST